MEAFDAASVSHFSFVVGASDWDDAARWWVDYPANRDLHVGGFPMRTPHDGPGTVGWGG